MSSSFMRFLREHPNGTVGFATYAEGTTIETSFYVYNWEEGNSTYAAYWTFSYSNLTLFGASTIHADRQYARNANAQWWGGIKTREYVNSNPRLTGLVAGQAVIPTMSQPSAAPQNVPWYVTDFRAEGVVWVGMSGEDEGYGGLLQTGVLHDVRSNQYKAWYEYWPSQPIQYYPGPFLVQPGDNVYMYVGRNYPSYTYLLEIQDKSDGRTVSYTTPSYTSFSPSWNEYIVETPEIDDGVYQFHTQLPSFSYVDFKQTEFCTIPYADGQSCFGTNDQIYTSSPDGYGISRSFDNIQECSSVTKDTDHINEGSYYRITHISSCYDWNYVN